MNLTGKELLGMLRRWLARHTPEINHQAVVKDILAEVEITPGYFLALNVANLIALCGLLLGSSPVIIGAMLISPLMGPILSFGFAFVTADDVIWRRALRKLVLSVALSILVAFLATLLSPLKEVTGEILARTRPNLYDLIIAFLAGIVGAGALCTKKRYLTVVPGVAIATAVIPPLSVSGFGAGTLDVQIFLGGFLLFFTNFVAIVLSTCAVFYFYGFRRRMGTEVELSQMKKRFAFLLAVLAVISIPLVVTLHRSISEIRTSAAVRRALGQELEQEKRSHVVSFRHAERDDGRLEIDVLLNTVSYLAEEEVLEAQRRIGQTLQRPAVLNLEQVLVQTGGLKPEAARAAPPPPRPPAEVVRGAGESVRSLVRKSVRRVERIIAPSMVEDFAVAFRDSSEMPILRLTVRRDAPFSEAEIRWLGRMLASELELPVDLAVETVPFFPPLVFAPGKTEISGPMKKTLLSAGEIHRRDPTATLAVEALPERPGARGRKLAQARGEAVVAVLVQEGRIPPERIRLAVGAQRQEPPTVRITVLAGAPDKRE
jgi:uncharacterized hydrophobic protein (TIGR00271 family)